MKGWLTWPPCRSDAAPKAPSKSLCCRSICWSWRCCCSCFCCCLAVASGTCDKKPQPSHIMADHILTFLNSHICICLVAFWMQTCIDGHIRIQAWSQCLTCKKTWKNTSQRCCMISYWLISSMNPSFGGGSHASQGCMWGCMWYHGHTSKKACPKNVLPEVPHLASRDISTQQVGHCYQQHLHRHRHVALQRGGGLAPQN